MKYNDNVRNYETLIIFSFMILDFNLQDLAELDDENIRVMSSGQPTSFHRKALTRHSGVS